ncbi:MAG: 5'-methylthioadenosine/adenosylhomocysteine nucleosidase [Burkholderiaceae bacterium]|nr:5'-methylthioadenosine/adenosylhomocysteine nucleosidase [Burkholderiaceae bacterium]
MSTLGILAALHDEIAGFLHAMGPDMTVRTIGQRDYHVGVLYGRPCVVVLARIGKVAAAATTVTLIREFGVTELVFTGLAGAVAPQVRVGDVVVAQALLQHDLSAAPLFPRYEVPLLGRSHFQADVALSAALLECATHYLDHDFDREVSPATRDVFGIIQPQVHHGLIISGDQFVSTASAVHALRAELPLALCVEMEGAAVAQICFEYDIPCVVIRTISDRADDDASTDFSAFLAGVASVYSAGILRRLLNRA